MNEENPTPQTLNNDKPSIFKIAAIISGSFILILFVGYIMFTIVNTKTSNENKIPINNIVTENEKKSDQPSIRECYMNDVVVDCSLVDSYNKEHPPLS